ncbi:protein tyrosine phosphatase [Variovorax sp. J22P168]|uniref:arsenate reductase/protein-tyrosine-phosphatase family protein n=1 Tax=Variovorax jilinensis TaxID=3053513 RepID=UPI0025785467|nr:protein tyrosine phosphatase [Variovorax sp. J22P168]MDM0014786.1 protein tyrosine phosphatase [Variovorax sp. J22P168]
MQKIGVLFVSRRNSLRSILAEACLNHVGSHRFRVFSCGQPGQIAGAIHPAALGALHSASIPLPVAPLRGWDAFTRSGAPRVDFVITLDETVALAEPRWPGQPDSAVWPFEDVAALDDPQAAAHAAIQVLYALRRRLELLVNLPMQGTDRSALRSDVRGLRDMH